MTSTDEARAGPALSGLLGMPQHPARDLVLGELHARPFLPLNLPLRIYHFAFMTTDAEMRRDRSYIGSLATARGFLPPPADAKYYRFDFGHWELRWEVHTEFTTYTWLTARDAAQPFMHPDPIGSGELSFVAPGMLIAAVHMSVLAPGSSSIVPTDFFNAQSLCVVKAAEESARLTTDFQVDVKGYTRFLIESKSLTPTRAGRLVQRALELETYRTLALLGLPEARRTGPELQTMEQELVGITQAISASPDTEMQRTLLTRLSKLAVSRQDLPDTLS